MTVTSQASGLPSCQGKRVRPSGLLLSEIKRPFGSFVTGNSAATKKALAMTSLIAWCLEILPDARLHTGRFPLSKPAQSLAQIPGFQPVFFLPEGACSRLPASWRLSRAHWKFIILITITIIFFCPRYLYYYYYY